MKIYFDAPGKYKMFMNEYYPMFARVGISTRFLPSLGVYIDKEYPNFPENLPHQHLMYRGDHMLMFIRMFTLEDALEAGWTKEFYENYRAVNINTVPHEMGHAIHRWFFGSDNSEIWDNVWRLMGEKEKINFDRGLWGKWKGQVVAYETFADYFGDMVMGKIENLPLMQYLWELMDLKVLNFKLGEKTYKSNGVVKTMANSLPNIAGTTYLPTRLIVEELRDVTLRDVYYDEKKKEITVIGGNDNENWEK